MSQPRRHSLIEAVINTAVGYALSLAAVQFVFPLFGISLSLSENITATNIMTVVRTHLCAAAGIQCAVAAEARIMSAPVATPLTRREQMMQVVQTVAREHGVAVADIMGRSKARRIAAARYAAIKAVHECHHELSTYRLGRFFNRDHTTIAYALGWLPNKRSEMRARASSAQEAVL